MRDLALSLSTGGMQTHCNACIVLLLLLRLQGDRAAARRKPLVSMAKEVISAYFKVIRCACCACKQPVRAWQLLCAALQTA